MYILCFTYFLQGWFLDSFAMELHILEIDLGQFLSKTISKWSIANRRGQRVPAWNLDEPASSTSRSRETLGRRGTATDARLVRY